ncbi:MAG: M23 family metallopeptidase [Bacteroidales bacterium]|nr:M23 family metallopeptidase [Bacteroidales bacterium]
MSGKKWTLGRIIRRVLVYGIGSLSMAVLYYVIFALIFSTDTERKLRRENRMYEQEYPELARKEALVADVVEGLKVKDDRIYTDIFHTSAPGTEPHASIDFLVGLDSITDKGIVQYSEKKIAFLESCSNIVEANFRQVMAAITDSGFVMPPMTSPLEEFSFAQTGASVGPRINPFYKVEMQHNGLDIIAPSGEPVLAAADGVVKEVVRSRKGSGNVVVIDHENGYFTRYAHLSDIKTAKGRKVGRGSVIGHVGMSGNSFAPHLHYEVLRDTVALDPVNHMFASVTPEEYINMMILSVSTGQSMD